MPYGVLHTYKYCCPVVYRLFSPIFVAFCNGFLPVGAMVPAFPKLIYIERVVPRVLI